jgi:predicted signal transduction protein with EAL and GGDEF domain
MANRFEKKTFEKFEAKAEGEPVVLSAKKLAQLNQMPIIETKLRISEDGLWVIHQTIITDIKSVKYYEKALSNNDENPSDCA